MMASWRDAMKFRGWFWFCPVFADNEPDSESPGLTWVVYTYRHWALLPVFWLAVCLEYGRGLGCHLWALPYNSTDMLFWVEERR